MKSLVINPGSTSTKVAIYQDIEELHSKTIRHSLEELSAFPGLMDQLEFRKKRTPLFGKINVPIFRRNLR